MTERQPDAQGDLIRYPFPRLLFYLYKKQLLGELEIAQPGGGMAGRIYFRDGLPVFTDLPFSHDVLGRVLLERGLINEDAFNASLQELASGEQLQGRILMEMGALDMHGLIEGLRVQLLRKLNRVFPMSNAAFAIFSGEHAHGLEGEEAHVQADPLYVIYHGVRNSFDASRMQPELDKLRGKLIGLPPEFQRVWSRYGMGEEMHPLVTLLLRGTMSLDHLYKVTNIGPVLTQMLVYTLWVTEVLIAGESSRRAATRRATGPMSPVAPHEQPHEQHHEQPGVASAQAFYDVDGVDDDALDEEPTNPDDSVAPVAQSFAPSAPQATPSAEFIVAEKPATPARAPVPSVGEEGVYEIPMSGGPGAPAREARATSEPEPEPELEPEPEPEPEAPVKADAGVAAKHNQLILKTFKRIQEADHYEVLELPRDAAEEQIREAYFELAKIFHPDRVAALGLNDVTKESEAIFRAINEAHTVLGDKQTRKAYDEELEGGTTSNEARDAFAAEFVFQKALVHLRKKNWPEALRGFQEAAKLNPSEGEHVAYVAWTLYSDPSTNKKQLLPKLKEKLLKAINLSPNSATCHYFLGEIYLAMSEERRAYTCFNRVLEIKPDHIEASRHIRIIRMRKEKQKEKKTGLFGRLTRKK